MNSDWYKPAQDKKQRLLALAQRIWTELESPQDDDMETVFIALIDGDEEKLANFIQYNIEEGQK